jgi:hypothetical protein
MTSEPGALHPLPPGFFNAEEFRQTHVALPSYSLLTPLHVLDELPMTKRTVERSPVTTLSAGRYEDGD